MCGHRGMKAGPGLLLLSHDRDEYRFTYGPSLLSPTIILSRKVTHLFPRDMSPVQLARHLIGWSGFFDAVATYDKLNHVWTVCRNSAMSNGFSLITSLRQPQARESAHEAAVRASSRSTLASVVPERFRTWKEWSAVSTICNVARGASFAHSGCKSARSASVSRVPCRNSIGTSTCSKCSARFVPGRPGGCSGKPKKIRPRTCLVVSDIPVGVGSDSACEVMRPPTDLPLPEAADPGRLRPLPRWRRARWR